MPFDILAQTAVFLDNAIDLKNLAIVTNCPNLTLCRMLPIIRMVLSLFVPCPFDLLVEMESWNAVITGSAATLLRSSTALAPAIPRLLNRPPVCSPGMSVLPEVRQLRPEIASLRRRRHTKTYPHHTPKSYCKRRVYPSPLISDNCGHDRLFGNDLGVSHYTDNIRWQRLKRRGFQPVSTNTTSEMGCIDCPSSWRTLAHDVVSCNFRAPSASTKGDIFFLHARHDFRPTTECSSAWQFSEVCLNESCVRFTPSPPAVLDNKLGICDMGLPCSRSSMFWKGNDHINGMLLDVESHCLSVVPIPLHNQRSGRTCLDDLAVNNWLDDLPRGVYSPARYQFCIHISTAEGVQVVVVACRGRNNRIRQILGVKRTIERNGVSGVLRCIYHGEVVQNKTMTAATSVLFQPELFSQILAHANLHDFLAWRSTCKATRVACADILSDDFSSYLDFWCPDRVSVAALRRKMSEEGTVAVGAVALCVLRLHTLNPLSNLHLVCPIASVEEWWAWGNSLGWRWCGKTEGEGVKAIRFVTTKRTIVTLTGVYSISPVHYVSQAAESALVTFVSGSGVYCGYPNLTFNRVTFCIRELELGFRIGWNCLKGFRYDNEFVDSRVPFCDLILEELPFEDWVTLSNTSSHVRVGVRNAFFEVLHARLLDFISPNRFPVFFSLLRRSNSVIAGALPLSMLRVLRWEPGHDLVLYCPAVSKPKWNNSIKVVYADGGHVLNILAKAPETALSSFLTSWGLVTAYPLMTMKRQSFSVIVTRDGQMIGGECLDGFEPVPLMDEMPDSYCGWRAWKDNKTFVFRYADLVLDLGEMGGNNVWSLDT
ncbi:hypothetical protein K435DRAFT_862038 [Dendrothele bispora CBS 962.96]|uniref:F-box domain-containing protein n=1 Tax=Dendrothele bispora (strain CBS 962.96) TaxID=1314807 RepID=A0A4S8LUD6_DENBC|nr:hypothetical protein K435DRAFT_862038 [Dendrothele bispora CBS 962.96]